MNRLKNKVALVTGGTSGIGEKITDALLQKGQLLLFATLTKRL
ncbi:hypothetical protein [Carnobacterium maltaromaticum]